RSAHSPRGTRASASSGQRTVGSLRPRSPDSTDAAAGSITSRPIPRCGGAASRRGWCRRSRNACARSVAASSTSSSGTTTPKRCASGKRTGMSAIRPSNTASASVDVITSRLAAHHFSDAAAAFREIGRVLRKGGLFVLVDNFAPDDVALDRFINELETLRDPSHVRNHTVRGWRDLLEQAEMRTTIDSELQVTKLDTESWLARSQTPPDRAEEVRRRLRAATPAAVDAFRISATTFAVRKLILVGRK